MKVSSWSKRLMLIALSFTGLGCASLHTDTHRAPSLKAGDTVAQHTTLSVPIESYRVKVASNGATQPFCFYEVDEMRRLGEAPLSIRPGEFKVASVQRMTYPRGGVKQLSLPDWLRPNHVDMLVQLELESPDQPHVKTLNCARRFTTAAGARFPDVVEMRLAMRGLTSIQRQSDLAYLR